jgi:hypothetical protein
MGDLEASAGSLTGSLAIVREIGAKREGAYALEGAAELAFRLNDPDHAIRFLAAARSLREEIGSPLSSAEQQERATFLDKVKARVGEHTFQQEFNLAQAPGFETAVDEAVAWLERSTPDASIGHPPPELDPQ